MLYSSVLAIIIAPMLIFIGIPFFVFYFYDVSWIFADPTILLEILIFSQVKDLRTTWLNSYLYSSFVYSEAFLITKTVISLVGLVLLVVSIAQLVYCLKKEKLLVRKGIYKYIRHPQNLAVLIITLPFFIFNGVRIGDIVTWVQFFFLMIIYSDFEDLRLCKKYPNEYHDYYKNSGFFLPRIVSSKRLNTLSILKNKKLRYIVLFLIYILTIIILYAFYLILPFYPLTI
jgi:protein-S-isoprenylcysteine O-methyltransferase Ste14